MGRARSRGRSGDHLDVMVIDARAVPVAAREGHCRRDSVGVCRVAEGLPVGVAGLFPPRKARAVGNGGDYSTDRWGGCIAWTGLWLAAKFNLLAGGGWGWLPTGSWRHSAPVPQAS